MVAGGGFFSWSSLLVLLEQVVFIKIMCFSNHSHFFSLLFLLFPHIALSPEITSLIAKCLCDWPHPSLMFVRLD